MDIDDFQDEDEELKVALQLSLQENAKQVLPKTRNNQFESHITKIEDVTDEETPTNDDYELDYALKLSQFSQLPAKPIHKRPLDRELAALEDEEFTKAIRLSEQEEYIRKEAETRRLFREQQDLEYEMSLARDKAKEAEKRAKEDAIRVRDDELRAREAEQQMMRERMRKEELKLEPEPPANQKDVAVIGVRLPNNGRLNRRFTVTTKLSKVKSWIDSELAKEESLVPFLENYDLVVGFPNKIAEDMTVTLEDLHLFPRALISLQSRI